MALGYTNRGVVFRGLWNTIQGLLLRCNCHRNCANCYQNHPLKIKRAIIGCKQKGVLNLGEDYIQCCICSLNFLSTPLSYISDNSTTIVLVTCTEILCLCKALLPCNRSKLQVYVFNAICSFMMKYRDFQTRKRIGVLHTTKNGHFEKNLVQQFLNEITKGKSRLNQLNPYIYLDKIWIARKCGYTTSWYHQVAMKSNRHNYQSSLPHRATETIWLFLSH